MCVTIKACLRIGTPNLCVKLLRRSALSLFGIPIKGFEITAHVNHEVHCLGIHSNISLHEILDEIAELIEDGDVRVHIDKAFPLDQVADAHRLLEGGHVRGKLVLDCGAR